MDTGNYCTVWADSHTGAVMRADHKFLHNTKIVRLAMNEEKAFNKPRSRNHPVGRSIAFTEMQQQLLGYNDVFTNLKFVQIPTKAFGYRFT